MFNPQFPMFIRWDADFRFCAGFCLLGCELSIGQIYQNVLNSYVNFTPKSGVVAYTAIN